VNQEPYVNTGLLQRPKRPVPEEATTFFSSQMDRGDGGHEEVEDVLSPSHQLDLSPRMMMRGRETKTRFSGSGIYANVVAQVCYSHGDARLKGVPFFLLFLSSSTHYHSSFLTSELLLKRFVWPTPSSHECDPT
jgi:hypothetical protein